VSAELPEAVGEARDEKQVKIEDSLTHSQTSGAGELHEPCVNTGRIIMDKEGTSALK
jgi:hypothetical protein